MYRKGQLKVTTRPCQSFNSKSGYCDYEGEKGHIHSVYDLAEDKDRKNTTFLPSYNGSEEVVIIGGPKQIRLLIADLQEALTRLERGV